MSGLDRNWRSAQTHSVAQTHSAAQTHSVAAILGPGVICGVRKHIARRNPF
ncbi:MAG: hypothetical protein LBH29_07360 [Elusimicrobiota bacterium]|nr:hypothetical protein [Elusimicrobiota bacterium]